MTDFFFPSVLKWYFNVPAIYADAGQALSPITAGLFQQIH